MLMDSCALKTCKIAVSNSRHPNRKKTAFNAKKETFIDYFVNPILLLSFETTGDIFPRVPSRKK